MSNSCTHRSSFIYRLFDCSPHKTTKKKIFGFVLEARERRMLMIFLFECNKERKTRKEFVQLFLCLREIISCFNAIFFFSSGKIRRR